jgi:hypothetical protein
MCAIYTVEYYSAINKEMDGIGDHKKKEHELKQGTTWGGTSRRGKKEDEGTGYDVSTLYIHIQRS